MWRKCKLFNSGMFQEASRNEQCVLRSEGPIYRMKVLEYELRGNDTNYVVIIDMTRNWGAEGAQEI